MHAIDSYLSVIGDDFYLLKGSVPASVIYIRDINKDLQIGWRLKEYIKHGSKSILVEQGIRMPKIENIYNDYEVHEMKKMGFKNPEPVFWLTYWRDVPENYIYMNYDQQWCDVLDEGSDSLFDKMIKLLIKSERPGWATSPEGSMLAIRSTIAKHLMGYKPCKMGSDVLKSAKLERSNSYTRFYEWFCQKEG